MTEVEFHERRTMFVIIDKTILITKKSGLTHALWLYELFPNQIDELLEKCTRGYILNDILAAYTGQHFSSYVDHNKLLDVIDLFKDRIKTIQLGAKPAQKNPWPGKITLPVEVYLQKVRK